MAGRRLKTNDWLSLANIVSPRYAVGIKAVILKRRKQTRMKKKASPAAARKTPAKEIPLKAAGAPAKAAR
jgi:hypothetical protein